MNYFNKLFSENFQATIEKTFGTTATYINNGETYSIPGTFIGYIDDENNSGMYEITSAYTGIFKVRKLVFEEFNITVPNVNEKLEILGKEYNIENINDYETGVITFALLITEEEKIELSARRRKR